MILMGISMILRDFMGFHVISRGLMDEHEKFMWLIEIEPQFQVAG